MRSELEGRVLERSMQYVLVCYAVMQLCQYAIITTYAKERKGANYNCMIVSVFGN
jgi:hypothetical protein